MTQNPSSSRKSPWRFLCLSAAILSGLWLIVDNILPWLMLGTLSTEAASIGIIGGADGPTAIFVTSQSAGFWNDLIPLVILILGIVGFLFLRRNKTKEQKEGEA